jgi:exodeoxyribonuclease V beta subunit
MSADYPTLDPLQFPLDGVRLIEASAGTGKTYAIANLYTRLVAERGLGVEHILVVTFTRSATEELRGRIRRRLREALAAMEAGEGDDFLLALGERCGEAGRERLRAAVLAMDEAAIHTIHGFCRRVLTDHAFESGSGFEAELVNDDKEYRAQAIRDFWRRRCYPLEREPAAWVHARWPTPDALLKSLDAAFSHHRVRLLPQTRPDLEAVRAEVTPLVAELREIWQQQRADILDLILQDKVLGRGEKAYRKDRVEAAVAELYAWLAGEPLVLSPPPAVGFFGNSALLAGSKPASIGKGLIPPQHPMFDLCDQIHAATRRLQRDFMVALQVEALQWCREEVRQRKAAANVLAPDDLLLGAHEALQGPGGERLAQCVSKSWPVALIDEFQDTDPLQYEIFRRVYAEAQDSALVMIGDPKQAIYSFRGADLFTYLEAARGVAPQQGRHSLDTNWRSAGNLVEAVNLLFSEGRPFVLEGAMAYRPVQAAGKADKKPLQIDGDDGAAMHLWHLQATEDNATKAGVIHLNKAEEMVAEGCASEIARLLTLGDKKKACLGEKSLQARHIAVLVRDRNEAAVIREALRQRGVGSSFISRDNVFASAEATWLLPLLEAVADEGMEAGLRRALAGPILGWDARRLEQLNQDELLLEAVQQRFADYARHWQRRGLAPMLNRLLHAEGVPARLLARDEGERALTNLRHLGELLQAASIEVHGGPRGLLRWLRDRMAAGGDSEEAQLRLESDENLVQIVTMHKSKGLQYPVVFLPFPWRNRPFRDSSERLAFHDEQGVMTLDLGSDDFGRHLPLAERERLAEDMRLLYVALTRAEHRIYCPWGNVRDAAGSAFAYLLHGAGRQPWQPGQGLTLDGEGIRDRLERLCSDHPECFTLVDLPRDPNARFTPRSAEAGDVELPVFRRRLQDDWRIASYSGFIAGHQDLPERPDFDALPTAPEPDEEAGAAPRPGSRFDFPKGVRAGQCLHGILELMDFQAGDTAELRELVRRQLRRQGLDLSWEGCVVRWLLQVVATPLDVDHSSGDGFELAPPPLGERKDASSSLTLAQTGVRQKIPEMAFYLPLSPVRAGDLERLLRDYRGSEVPQLAFGRVQGMLNGFIDLVLEHRGRYYVLDYKSNYLGPRLEDYGPGAMGAAVREHLYDLQYLIYSLALHRYLGTRLPDYEYERHFGGVRYLFLRGMDPARPGGGVYPARPALALIQSLDRLFSGVAETAA